MSKGDETRTAILDEAARLASTVGLDGLTIGTLADRANLSKSGLFGHFQSKEALQLQVLDHVIERFIDVVIRPALAAPRGEPRARALFDRWLAWESELPGGCLFITATIEMDDRPGPVRDRLVRAQRDFLDSIAQVFRSGIAEGHFHAEADPELFAYQLHALMLGYHHASRLLRDPAAGRRAAAAFEALLAAARAPVPQPSLPAGVTGTA